MARRVGTDTRREAGRGGEAHSAQAAEAAAVAVCESGGFGPRAHSTRLMPLALRRHRRSHWVRRCSRPAFCLTKINRFTAAPI